MEVVILGAGFAGINTAVNLSRKLDGQTGITLVDVNNYHLVKPMLHEVATASVDRGHILQPIRHIVKLLKPGELSSRHLGGCLPCHRKETLRTSPS